MKILITGGAGFIGTNTAIYFASQNHQITIVDNLSRSGVKTNAEYIHNKYPNVKLIVSDILEAENYLEDLKSADFIIHLAGQTAVTSSIEDPRNDFRNNVWASFNLLENVRKYNPNAVLLYSSTNKVYGDLNHHELKLNEENKKYENITCPNGVDEKESLNFISPYGCSKGASDQYFLDYARIYDLKTVVFRQSCIYGQFQMGVEDQGWVAHFSKQFLMKSPIQLFGNGYQVRDLLFVQDLVKAYQLAFEKINVAKGQAFNIGGGVNNSFSLLNVIEMLEKQIVNKVEVKFSEPRKGDQLYFVSNNDKFCKLTGWKVETQFEKGLIDMVGWQKENLDLIK